MRLTKKVYGCGKPIGKYVLHGFHSDIAQKLGQLEDIEDNLPAFNGLQHFFEIVDLMETDEGLCFTYKGKSFVLERQE